MKCNGNSRITFIPASNYFIPGYCAGQKGVATLMCSLTGRVEGTFTATSCTKGYGTGYDKKVGCLLSHSDLKKRKQKLKLQN